MVCSYRGSCRIHGQLADQDKIKTGRDMPQPFSVRFTLAMRFVCACVLRVESGRDGCEPDETCATS